VIVLIRHASAGDRDEWDGDDRLRPLDEKGRRQSEKLVEQLADAPLARILSSPYVRCVQTVEPLAGARGLPIETLEELGEVADPRAAVGALTAADGAAVCVHGDLVEELLGRSMKKGAFVRLDSRDLVRGSRPR
jgi:phosphohistidine phosphatase SixA